ncbi:hypothetical protein ABPG72_008727 [Tetrahymena utriculariae]
MQLIIFSVQKSCPANQYLNASGTKCLACTQGSTSQAGQSYCQCLQGYYSNDGHATSVPCQKCELEMRNLKLYIMNQSVPQFNFIVYTLSWDFFNKLYLKMFKIF